MSALVWDRAQYRKRTETTRSMICSWIAKPIKQSVDKQQDDKIKQLQRKVASVARAVERKVLNGTFTTTPQNLLNTTPYQQLINGLSQGTSKSTRTGARVHFLSLNMNLYLYNSTNTFSNDNAVRIILVREKPALGASLSLQSLFGTSTPSTWSTYEQIVRDNKPRFTILYDQIVNLWSNIDFLQRSVRIKMPLNFTTDYSRGNAGDYTDIDTNSLWLLFVTDKGTVSVTYVKGEWDLEYEDA